MPETGSSLYASIVEIANEMFVWGTGRHPKCMMAIEASIAHIFPQGRSFNLMYLRLQVSQTSIGVAFDQHLEKKPWLFHLEHSLQCAKPFLFQISHA